MRRFFPTQHWQRCDGDEAYPAEFVAALTEAGYLAALASEEYGGFGLPLSAACAILEESHLSASNAAARHAQMYTIGILLRHGSSEQKHRILPGIPDGSLRLQVFGVTEPTGGAAAEACPQSQDGFGFAREYDVERMYRDMRLYQVVPVSISMILACIVEHVLGMSRSC